MYVQPYQADFPAVACPSKLCVHFLYVNSPVFHCQITFPLCVGLSEWNAKFHAHNTQNVELEVYIV
jgi:hypothetical protein